MEMSQDQPPSDKIAASQPSFIVAFDFDGTLTIKDSYTAFLKWRAGQARWTLGLLRLIPATLAYVFHRDRGRLKAAATREFLRGVPRTKLEADARAFAESYSRKLLRPDAVAAWRRWRADHAHLVIVTASPEITVAPFARGLGADGLIGTQLAFDAQDRVTGAFSTPNCRGAEKVRRLKAEFGEDLDLRAAYGDTTGDREMIAAANIKGYRVFGATP